MKALTIWQPWASLIVAGWKPHEFRSYPAPKFVRGRRIVIHAGARKPRPEEIRALSFRLHGEDAWTTGLDPACMPFLQECFRTPAMLPIGAGLGTAVLGEPVRADSILPKGKRLEDSPSRPGDWNWGWPLTAIEPFEPVVPCRGAQGFWEWRA